MLSPSVLSEGLFYAVCPTAMHLKKASGCFFDKCFKI